MEAAFVDIGLEKNGFLHVSDVIDSNAVLKEMLPDEDESTFRAKKKEKATRIQDILKKGADTMVQVVKEAMGTKGPRLTTFISIPGRYIVLTPYDKGIGISRRITDKKERVRIRNIIKNVGMPGNTGCIVRTAAEKSSENSIKSEVRYLLNLWKKVKKRADKNKAPALVYEEYGVVLRMVRDIFTEDFSRLIVDSTDEYNRIIKFLNSFMPDLKKKVKCYKARIPLFQKYDLDKKIDQIFERKVALKSGGYLIIEQTEGVVVIDVNTGSFIGKKSLEETAFKTNLEAADEIPTQLLLRDIGGIVIIDFIDMGSKEHRDKVYSRLQERVKVDKARISIRGISQFGIVEMTRQRMRKSIEGSSHIECPYCGGKGMIKSPETISIEVARRIDKVLAASRKNKKKIKVKVHPDINLELLSDQAKVLSDIQRKYRCNIEICEDNTLHIEDAVIEEC
jgi:ribonuclease G